MENKTFSRQDFVNWGKQGIKKVIKKHGKNPANMRWEKARKLSTVSPKKPLDM